MRNSHFQSPLRGAALAAGVALAAFALTGCSDRQDVVGPLQHVPTTLSANQVPHAAYTSVNEAIDGPDHCANGNPLVNCNIYGGKDYVWLSGGPLETTLDDGSYFFAVVEPSGQGKFGSPNDGSPHNLSDDFDAYTNRTFSIASGALSYGGSHDFDSDMIRLMPYANTTNPGGVYILAICRLDEGYPVDPASCKYDAFKVREGDTHEGGNPEVAGLKYYDLNVNGQWDLGEPGIPGWLIDVTLGGSAIAGSPLTTVASPAGTFSIELLKDNTYHFAERQALAFSLGGPVTGFWSQTGNTVDQSSDFLNTTTLNSDMSYDVAAVEDGVTTGLNFGNVCYLNPGGKTMGFWSNKNGLGLITSSDFTALNAFALRDALGADKDFVSTLTANKTAFNAWLLAANASNMAYMLSAQMSATYLSVQHGFTDGSMVVYNGMTITQLLAYANNLLGNPIATGPFAGQNGAVTVGASALRTEQEAVKNVFDKINNNGGLGGFLQGWPNSCPISF